MNIEALSIQLGTSYRTVYRRIAKAGLDLESMKDETGQLTTEAIQTISALFDNGNDRTISYAVKGAVNRENIVKVKPTEKALAEAEKRAADAEARATAAEAEVRRLSDRVDDLTRQLSDLRSDRDEWRRAASESRALQLQQMRLLPERVGVVERVRGWFNRTKKAEE